jgi:outer membrane protein insertion porin family
MVFMSLRAFVVVFLLFILPGAALADTIRVSEIQIKGNQRVETSAIQSVISVKPGQPITMEDIDNDIRAIYKLGWFKDVSAETEEKDGEKILVFRVAERPLVREVKFVGNKEFKDEKLRGLISLKPPGLYEPRDISKSVNAIKKTYVEEGYYAVEVTTKEDVNSQNEATIVFDIQEGTKVLVRSIRFEGNTVFSDGQLKKVMQTKERWFLSWLTGRGTYKEDVLQNDLEIIADQYYNDGYVQVKVRKPVISLSPDKKYMDILIWIEEGKQFRIGKIDIQGDLLKSRKDLLALVKEKPGDIFSRKLLRTDILAINDLYADQGYAYVNVSPLTHVDAENRLIDIKFDIEKGIQVNIDQIRISGNTKTRDKVIRREMQLAEKDLYSASKLKESRRQINNLGFFDEVNLNTAKGPEESKMDIDVQVKEKPTGTFSVGFGYSSVDGFIGQGAITQENFLGRALKLNLAGSIGGKSTTYQLGILDPYFLDMNLSLGFDLYNTRREWTDFTKKSTGGDVKAGFPVMKDLRAFFIYRYEDKDIFDIDPSASDAIQDQAGKSTISSISGTLTRDTTDYRLDPTRGSISAISAEFAGLGGTEDFAKYEVDHRYFIPFKWGTVFSIHGHLGYIQEIGGKEIPIDERFFLGGLNSLRGFVPREVGPRVKQKTTTVNPETGEVTSSSSDYEYLGGDKEAFFNFEYVFPLIKDMGIKMVTFFDTGNAWGSGEDFFSSMRYSVGTGIRWFSPMGPLRLEWGYNLDPKEGEPHSDFQFAIGRFF